MKIHSACLALLLLPHACLGADTEDPKGPLQIGDHHDISISSNVAESDLQPVVSSDGKTSTYTLHHENASYLSVHLSNLDLPTGCSFSLTDGNGGQEYTLTGRGLYDLGTFWGHHVNGDTMVLTLHCDSEMASPVFEVDDYVAGYPNNGVGQSRHLRSSAASHPPDEDFLQAIGHRDLSICGADDKRNAICYKSSHPTEYTKAKAVARLYINGSGACTGWLVSESSLLFTNEHCIASLFDVQNTDFEFMGEEDICTTTPGDGSWMSNRGPIFDGSVLVAANESWDYALIQLDGNPAATYGHLELENRRADIDEEIYIPQHPGGRPKELGILDSNHGGNCKVKGFRPGCAPEDMQYTCDTEGGSSGSPVLARSTDKVIALHHCGGGCNGNLGAPINKFYSDVAEYITDDPSSLIVGETGRIQLSSTIEFGIVAEIAFRKQYINPVVVAFINTRNGGQSISARVRDISSSGCKLFMQEPDNQGHAAEWVSYIVVESGRNTLEGGIIVEAGIASSTIIHRGGQSFNGHLVQFEEAFSNTPAILHSIMTYNNNDFMASLVTDVRVDSFIVAMEAADTRKDSSGEDVGWIAFSSATGSTSSTSFTIGTANDGTNDGVDDSPHVIDLTSANFNGNPDIVVSLYGVRGKDGSWARGAGVWSKDAQHAYAEEDQILQSERRHIDEQFAWAAFTANTDLIATA
mmetsp:Transcript_25965/g.33087  ORF Transcript_25965/g.33087 Transcript_25965/m.33087 type:complete len:694 (+) Transcript_25965:46-2127(+)